MKYLKKFNEDISITQPFIVESDIKLFCDNHLAYLYDEGYSLYTYDDVDEEIMNIQLLKGNSGNWSPFILSDISDYFIPFINILSQKYDATESIIFHSYSEEPFYLTVDDIINNNISDKQYNTKIVSISIRIWRFSNINESLLSDKKIEIKKYCENYLAYVMEYFKINVIESNNDDNKYTVMFERIKLRRKFSWESIKNHFIPFFTMIVNDYNVDNSVNFTDWCDEILEVESDYVLDDKIEEINMENEKYLRDIDLNSLNMIFFYINK